MVRKDWEAIKGLIEAYLDYHNRVMSHKFDSTRIESARKEFSNAISIIETGIDFHDDDPGAAKLD